PDDVLARRFERRTLDGRFRVARPHETGRAELLRFLGERIEILARVFRAAGYDEATYFSAGVDRGAEDREVRVFEGGRHVGQLHARPQVGFIGAVARHGVRVREA